MAKLRKLGARSRADRRKDAELRQEEYNKLTPQQKLDRLPRCGESKKEIKRLVFVYIFHLRIIFFVVVVIISVGPIFVCSQK